MSVLGNPLCITATYLSEIELSEIESEKCAKP